MDTAKEMHLSSHSVMKTTGGQGVHREVESEGFAEKYRAVIEGATPLMNRSAKGGAKVEPAEAKAFSHSPTAPRCLPTARYRKIWT